jgi:hypothetical protein
MGYVYINPPIYGFQILMDEGALRKGTRRHRRAVIPTSLVTDVAGEAKWLRDLGDDKWQGTKGSEEFHQQFLGILNYLCVRHGEGVLMYYVGGHRGTEERERPEITTFIPMPEEAGDRLDFLDNFVQVLQYHYGPSEAFSPSQVERVLNYIATLVSEDAEMVDLIQMA